MASLVLRNVYKSFAGIDQSDTSRDTSIDVHLDQCSARVETFCKRKFLAADYTEFYSGSGKKIQSLRQRPVNSIASIYEDLYAMWGYAPNAFAASTLLTAGTNYALMVDQPNGSSKRGHVYRIDSVWPRPVGYQPGVISTVEGEDTGNLKITYNAGFTTIPADIQQAVCMLVSATRRIAKFGTPTSSESWEDYSVAIANAAADAVGALPPDTLATLISYRDWVIG